MNYEDWYPDAWKPPDIEINSGRKVLDAREPRYEVTLDSGAFRALWELLEAEARRKYPTHEALAGTRALLRAVEALRTAFFGAQEGFVARVENPAPAPVQPVPFKKSRVFKTFQATDARKRTFVKNG